MDTCVFVAYADTEDSDEKHKKILTFIEKSKDRKDIDFYASSWALTEAMKVLLIEKKKKKQTVLEFSDKIVRTARLGDLKFEWINKPLKKGYDFDDFFYDVQERLLAHRIGIGDIMHLVLMDMHKIDTIVTFDDKDFNKFKEIKAIKPQNLIRYKY